MGGLLLALGLVAGIVGLAWRQADDPTIKKFLEEQRLRKLVRKLFVAPGTLTLPEAEDGLILASRHGDRALAKKFTKVVTYLKKRRLP